jgi:phosphoglycolate phosphatase
MTDIRSSGNCGVLFDLDGTLADTAPDMAYALNRVLESRGRAPLSFEQIRPHVSHGGKAMIQAGFGLTPEDAEFAPLRQEFLDIYRDNVANDTRLFPGTKELLTALDQRAIPWGIVTNKPAWLTDPLMTELGLEGRAACIVSGDTTPRAKPHPEPILHACRRIQRSAERCFYVGDAARDIAAGRAAGTHTLVALFGYLADDDEPETWGADGMIEHPLDILSWLDAST